MKKLILATLLLVGLTGCDQWVARKFGGDIEHTLPTNAQLVTVTWKNSDMWYLYYIPETNTCVFKESSVAGVLEGSVTFPNCNYTKQ